MLSKDVLYYIVTKLDPERHFEFITILNLRNTCKKLRDIPITTIPKKYYHKLSLDIISRMPHLHNLHIQKRLLSDSMILHLSNLTKLNVYEAHFRLQDNNANNLNNLNLSLLTRLTSLRIYCDSKIGNHLQGLTSLTKLVLLEDFSVNNTNVVYLVNLRKLRIAFSCSEIGMGISCLTKLESLKLLINPISSTHIMNLTNLRSLTSYYGRFTNDAISRLTKLEKYVCPSSCLKDETILSLPNIVLADATTPMSDNVYCHLMKNRENRKNKKLI